MSAEQGQMLADMVWRVVAVGVVLWLVGAAFIAYAVKTKNQALIERFFVGAGVVSKHLFMGMDWVYQRIAGALAMFFGGFVFGAWIMLKTLDKNPDFMQQVPPIETLPTALVFLVGVAWAFVIMFRVYGRWIESWDKQSRE